MYIYIYTYYYWKDVPHFKIIYSNGFGGFFPGLEQSFPWLHRSLLSFSKEMMHSTFIDICSIIQQKITKFYHPIWYCTWMIYVWYSWISSLLLPLEAETFHHMQQIISKSPLEVKVHAKSPTEGVSPIHVAGDSLFLRGF